MRRLEFASVSTLLACVERGLGVTLCPEVTVRVPLAEGRLARLNWAGDLTETGVFMIRHVDKWCSPLLRRFMELCRECVRPGGDLDAA